MDAPQRSVFLSPGEHFVGDARYRVRTLLGACVSITLWQRERRLGAMQLMLQGLARLGVALQQCEAKLFGGGDMFPGRAIAQGVQVGRRNGDAAHALLAAHGIALVSHSLFGVGHRKIVFDIATRDVWARHEQAVEAA